MLWGIPQPCVSHPQCPQTLPIVSTDLSKQRGDLPLTAPPSSLGVPLLLSALMSSSLHAYWNLYRLFIN